MSPLVTVVVASYNEAENIRDMYRRLTAVLAPIVSDYELIFVENGSSDSSLELLRQLASGDHHVAVISLSRNFGSQAAFSAGLHAAEGDVTVLIDGDLQDPPEVIPLFLDRWRSGYDVVYGVRTNRLGVGWTTGVGYRIFYRIFQRASYVNMPRDAGDFSLLDRKVVSVLNNMPENDKFIRGLRSWAGFNQVGVPYVRQARAGGSSSFTLRENINWAVKGIFSFSFFPLEAISKLAVALTVVSLLGAVGFIVEHFLTRLPQGYTSLIVVMLILGSIQLASLGIMGRYLAHIYIEVKRRPEYLVQYSQNLHRLRATERTQTIPDSRSVRSD